MPKVSEAHAAARREQILLAAMQCFANKGFHKTTVQDICKAAQLSPGAVYSYFESKDEIIEALGKAGEEMNENTFDLVGTQQYASPQAAVTGALSLFLSQYRQPMFQTAARMDAMLLAESLSNEQLADITQHNYNRVLDRIRQMVSQTQEAGAMDPALDATAVSQVLFSLVQGLSTQILMNAGEEADSAAYQKAVMALVNGTLFQARENKD
jgi:AcrR family transcriptional regulator